MGKQHGQAAGSNRKASTASGKGATTKRKRAAGSERTGTIGDTRLEASRAFSPRSRLAVRGINVLVASQGPAEKQKVSLTLDRELLDEIHERFGDEKLSSAVNALLHEAVAQSRLQELVEEMEKEAGPASPEAYDRVFAQWFAEPD